MFSSVKTKFIPILPYYLAMYVSVYKCIHIFYAYLVFLKSYTKAHTM